MKKLTSSKRFWPLFQNQPGISLMKRYKKVLTIAGSDSGGGAGIQADLKTFSALGCYGMSVITALTAQNTLGVAGIHPVPVSFVEEQIDAVMEDMGTDGVKIGMLYSAGLIEAVAARLKKFDVKKIVIDPVMVAQSGDSLMERDSVDALKEFLIPLASVLTPNLPEASVLLGRPLNSEEEIQQGARDLCALGCDSVLIKGGHLAGDRCTDALYLNAGDKFSLFDSRRIQTENNHGTGCTLSSAIAAFLVSGYGIEEAVEKGKAYITGALSKGASYLLGQGHGPVHHFHNMW